MPMEYNLLIIGILLIIAEIIIPGFGVFGVLGLVSLTIGSFFVMGGDVAAFFVLLFIYLLIGAVVLLMCFYFPKESKWNPFVLWDKQKNSDGYTGSSDFTQLLGKTAVTLTPLRPAGTVMLDGERVDVSSFGDYIDKDVIVKVSKVEGNKIFVCKI